ncbi:MAG: hypothetical protein ACE5FD_03560 [Anaerolineae bacterium]
MANDTISAASTEVANQTNLDTLAWFELNVTFGTAPSDTNPTVDVYMATAPDGTNYETAPLTGGANQGHMFVGSFPIQKVTSAQRIVIGPIALPPTKLKVYLDNQTGQAMAASGNTLDIITDNLEGQ